MTPEAVGDRPGREEQFDEILAEYFQMAEAGRTPGERDFLARYPEFAEKLKEFFADKQRFDRLAKPFSPSHVAVRRPATVDQGEAASADPGVTVPLAAAQPSASPSARCLGDYELLEEVACGGMGIVYRARQRGLNRIVAVKMILAAQLASRGDVERFRREAEAAANLRHRNIVKIHEVDEQGGLHFFSMDFIEGKNLGAMVRDGPLPADRAARYVKKIAEAIHYAHQQGILHRDLKPANVLVDQDDEPVVTDFGLAKRMKADSQLTGSGDVLGTPSYMSPEQAAGRAEIGPASDVYGLGAILYELLTGRAPFRGETPADTLMDVLTMDPAAPRKFNPKVARGLETIALKCLDRQPASRYASAAALAADLGRFLEGESIRARPTGLVRRTLHWVRGVPLVAALTGRAFHKPTVAQKKAQRAINAFGLVAVLAIAVAFLWPVVFPGPIALLGGLPGPGYCYDQIVQWLAPRLEEQSGRAVTILPSGGSNDNVPAVVEGRADLALTHLSAKSLEEMGVAIVAPLYYGFVYVVVRDGSKINDISDLRDKRISLGPPSLGMRDAAEKVLKAHGVEIEKLDQSSINLPFRSILEDETMEGAIITTGEGYPDLERAFAKGFKALSLTATGKLVKSSQFEVVVVPIGKDTKITTVRSPVVLVARWDAREKLVTATLEALYDESPTWQPCYPFLLGKQDAASWTLGRQDVHATARKFFLNVAEEAPSR